MIQRALFYAAILFFVAYGAVLIWKTSFAVGGSDAGGYFCTAKRIVAGSLVEPVDALARLELPESFDRVFMPLAHEPGPRRGTMVPFYPPGYPLHLAAAAVLGGWEYAPHFVSPIAALLLVVATYFLGRELGLSRLLAFLAAVLLAGCSTLLFIAVQAMSDVVAALWTTAAVVFALRSRKRDAWAAASGAAFGLAVLVRPTSALAAPALALALAWRWRALVLFGVSGLPFAGYWFRWNNEVYGSPFRTGYSGLMAGALAWGNFPPRFTHYTLTLGKLFTPLVPLAWLGVGADRRVPGRDRALLLVWFAAYLLFYCFWGSYETWWYTRYLLPALPALVVAAVLVARDLLNRLSETSSGRWHSKRLAVALGAALLVAVLVNERLRMLEYRPLGVAEGEKTYLLAMDLVKKKLPDRSVVLSMQMGPSLKYYTDFLPARWDWLTAETLATLREAAEKHEYRLYALLLPFEEGLMADKGLPPPGLPGKWSLIGQARDVKLWQLD